MVTKTQVWGLPMNPASRMFPAAPAIHVVPNDRRTTYPRAPERPVGCYGHAYNAQGRKVQVWIPYK